MQSQLTDTQQKHEIEMNTLEEINAKMVEYIKSMSNGTKPNTENIIEQFEKPKKDFTV